MVFAPSNVYLKRALEKDCIVFSFSFLAESISEKFFFFFQSRVLLVAHMLLLVDTHYRALPDFHTKCCISVFHKVLIESLFVTAKRFTNIC